MYIRNSLRATINETLMREVFKESLWCNVSMQRETLLVGLCYCSLSSSTENIDILLKLFDVVYRSAKGGTHLLILGDFNYSDISISTETVKAGDAASLTERRSLSLIQIVVKHTRVRHNKEPSTLDYVFTEGENLIEEPTYGVPLGKSDHFTIKWRMWRIVLKTNEIVSQ